MAVAVVLGETSDELCRILAAVSRVEARGIAGEGTILTVSGGVRSHVRSLVPTLARGYSGTLPKRGWGYAVFAEPSVACAAHAGAKRSCNDSSACGGGAVEAVFTILALH